MITSVEFKKHISKTFSTNMKEHGFKGSGFNYLMDTDSFVFVIGIQASQYGGQCCAEFGIQPKSIDTNGFETLNFKKLKYYNCELRMRIAPIGQGDQWWKYSLNESENIQSANHITRLVEERVIPIINLFRNNPDILESIEPNDLDNIYKNVSAKLFGMELSTTDIRLAWALAKSFSNININKAKAFARYGLSKMEDSNKFFGKADFEKILKE